MLRGSEEQFHLADQTGIDLKLASERPLPAVHVEREERGFALAGSGHDQAGFSVEDEMQMPTEQPRFILARIEQRPRRS